MKIASVFHGFHVVKGEVKVLDLSFDHQIVLGLSGLFHLLLQVSVQMLQFLIWLRLE